MMLAARGVRARLVTGSYGGEEGLFSSTIVVRAENLHAWVEADLDGSGFEVLEPTPPAGIPPALTSFSLLSRLVALGREIEFFYDRRILGFDSADQVGAAEADARRFLGAPRRSLTLSRSRRGRCSRSSRPIAVLLVAGLLFLAYGFLRRSSAVAPAPTRAYLALRRLLARRRGALAPSVPPAEVARLFAAEVPEGERTPSGSSPSTARAPSEDRACGPRSSGSSAIGCGG